MKTKIILAAMIAFLVALPVSSGGKHKKCQESVGTCLHHMVEKLKSTGFIGLELDVKEKTKALVVTKIIEGSPAQKAGIKVGDELYALNGMRYNGKNDEAINKVKVPGNTVTCTVKRNGANKKFKLTLIPMPADLMAKYIGEHMMEHANDQTKLAKK